MDIERILTDLGVPHVTKGTHSHGTEGWYNIHCPFCAGSRDYHMGIHEKGACHCWRCGGHPLNKTLAYSSGLKETQIQLLIKKYKFGIKRKQDKQPIVSINPFKYPTPNSKMTKQYKQYVEKRGFDADKIEKEWGVFQTGPVSLLDGISYKYRIIIPIKWDEEIVSFQARDITGKASIKYLACPKKREKIEHKNILYGEQNELRKSPTVIIVEGVTDVWRLGKSAVATFGISFRTEQVLELSKLNSNFVILFDKDAQAQEQARKLNTKLRALGKHSRIEIIEEDDPGSMKQEDADYLIKNLVNT